MGSGSSSSRRITKTSLALLWLLSSSEIFGCCRRIESTGAGLKLNHQHHHHGHCPSHDVAAAGDNDNLLARSWRGLTQGVWGLRPGADQHSCAAASSKSGAGSLLKRRGGGHAHTHHGATAGDLTTLGLPLPLFKILLQLLLTGLNVACWLIPMKIKRFRESPEVISLANAFSGGVFLSLAFGHMIPHSIEGFDAAGFAHNVPFLVTLTGYLLIFFVEKIAFDTHSFIEEHHHGHGHGHSHAVADGGGVTTTTSSAVAKPASPAAGSGRSAVVLLFALAVHSIFETMALGLSDTPLQAGLLATSIALHQPAESIALLVAFLKSGLSESQTTRYLAIFSVVGTLGVFLGLAVDQLASDIWDSVFVALAAGTFVYVGCTEIVAEEFEDQENKYKKFFSLLAGVGIVGAITAVTEGWEHH